MSKDKELIFTYLRLIKVMSENKSLLVCLMPLDDRYLPKQSESVIELLGKLKDTAKIFISCMATKTDTIPTSTTTTTQQLEESENSKKLAD